MSVALDLQAQAIMCHQTILANIALQFALQAKTAGISSDVILRAIRGDYAVLIDDALVASASLKGRPLKLAVAEYM